MFGIVNRKPKKIAIILHNIRSAHNVGSLFRTADAAGVSKIYLTGSSPRPIDRFGRENSRVLKTALGAEKSVPWEYVPRIGNLMKKLKREGFFIVAVEQTPRSRDYRIISIKQPTVFIFGNEVRGINTRIVRQCDKAIFIPMGGKKESLNVSVAAGIVLFGVRK